MKQFNNIATIFLAGLLMLSTVGVTLNKHYCMGRLKNVAVFEEAKSCAEKMGMEEDCPKNCCDDESHELRIKELNKATFDVDLTPDLKLVATITLFVHSLGAESSLIETPDYTYYKPPLIEQDIPILVQSFLI